MLDRKLSRSNNIWRNSRYRIISSSSVECGSFEEGGDIGEIWGGPGDLSGKGGAKSVIDYGGVDSSGNGTAHEAKGACQTDSAAAVIAVSFRASSQDMSWGISGENLHIILELLP